MNWLKSNKWNIMGLLFAVWLIFTIVYALNFVVVPEDSTKTYETVKFIFLSISVFGVLFSTLLSSFNSLEATSNIQDKLRYDKTENSFSFIARWDSPSLKAARDITREVRKQENKLSPDEIMKKIKTVSDLERSVITMFNYFEEMFMSIEASRVNELILVEAFADIYVSIYGRFNNWVESQSSQIQKKHLESFNRKCQEFLKSPPL